MLKTHILLLTNNFSDGDKLSSILKNLGYKDNSIVSLENFKSVTIKNSYDLLFVDVEIFEEQQNQQFEDRLNTFDKPVIYYSSNKKSNKIRSLKTGQKNKLFLSSFTELKIKDIINKALYDRTETTISKLLEEENARFKLAIQHSHEIIFMTDAAGRINYINPQFEKYYKYNANEIIGKTPQILKSGRRNDDFYREFWNNLLEGNNLNIEFENKTKFDEIVIVEESISAYFDENNRIAGFISIQRDISEKKQNEDLLRRALDKAEESDNLKAAFLNQMSHEIRTPLNSILGFMSLMEEELINRGVKDLAMYFDSVNRSALRLQRTIENILAMSNIQVGNYFTSFTKIDLGNIINLILDDFESLAEEKNIEVIFRNNTENATIYADSYTIIQSFQHLIDNAFKFTNKGLIEILIYESEDTLCVDVKDTGVGISKEYMEKLFKPFSQEEVGYGRSYDGNGLGLALAREYLRLNYANISVTSEKGTGSTFTVTFYKPKQENEFQ